MESSKTLNNNSGINAILLQQKNNPGGIKYRQVTIRVTEAQHRKLRVLSDYMSSLKQEKIKVSVLVRSIIQTYLEESAPIDLTGIEDSAEVDAIPFNIIEGADAPSFNIIDEGISLEATREESDIVFTGEERLSLKGVSKKAKKNGHPSQKRRESPPSLDPGEERLSTKKMSKKSGQPPKKRRKLPPSLDLEELDTADQKNDQPVPIPPKVASPLGVDSEEQKLIDELANTPAAKGIVWVP